MLDARPCATCVASSTGPAGSPKVERQRRCPTRSPDTELPSWGIDEAAEPVRAPTAEEVQPLLGEGQQLDPALLRPASASSRRPGIRRGEACALRWSDVDWREAAPSRSTSPSLPPTVVPTIKSPKTRASIRAVAVDAGTLQQLEQSARPSSSGWHRRQRCRP